MKIEDKITKMEVKKLISLLREQQPVIHCITNNVTVNDCANILLAIGASPIMAQHIKEAAEVTGIAGALVCNLGATRAFGAMESSADEALKRDIPVVLDPVGVSASSYRRDFATEFLESGKVSVLRSNLSEIKSLMRGTNSGGIDVSKEDMITPDNLKSIAENAAFCAKKYNIIVVLTGETDIITDGENLFYVSGGSRMIKRITGGGCMSSAVIGAFLSASAANSKKHIALGNHKSQKACSDISCLTRSAAASCSFMRMMSEAAARKTRLRLGGTMTFRNELIDACSLF